MEKQIQCKIIEINCAQFYVKCVSYHKKSKINTRIGNYAKHKLNPFKCILLCDYKN